MDWWRGMLTTLTFALPIWALNSNNLGGTATALVILRHKDKNFHALLGGWNKYGESRYYPERTPSQEDLLIAKALKIGHYCEKPVAYLTLYPRDIPIYVHPKKNTYTVKSTYVYCDKNGSKPKLSNLMCFWLYTI